MLLYTWAEAEHNVTVTEKNSRFCAFENCEKTLMEEKCIFGMYMLTKFDKL